MTAAASLPSTAKAPASANNGAGEGGAHSNEVPMSAAIQLREDPTPVRSNTINPMQMVQQALDSGAGIEVLTKLMDLQERWEKTQARKDFDEAIAAAKAEIKPVARNKKGHNDKRYADFAAYAREVDPILASVGLSYRFRTEQDDRIKVTCILSHKSGHSETNTLAGPADSSGSKNAIQAIGSTLTYLQRYTLTQALGLAASDDDDGRQSTALPVSAAADAAIAGIRECRTLEALRVWREQNDAIVQKLDRNDKAAVTGAWSEQAREIRSEPGQ